MPLTDLFKIFTLAFRPNPIERRRDLAVVGSGVAQADAIAAARDQDIHNRGRPQLRLRSSNEMVDTGGHQDRKSRYKEYARMRSITEVETAMTILADETCIAGSVEVETFYDGPKTIRWLAENRADSSFLVYGWDAAKGDFCLAWAKNPRMTKVAPTRRVFLDNGTDFRATHDHRILRPDGEWITAGELDVGSELAAFYRLAPNGEKNKLRTGQYPRVRSLKHGWMSEREFADIENRGGQISEHLARVSAIRRMVTSGMSTRQIEAVVDHRWVTIKDWFAKLGFTTRELQWLGEDHGDTRRVIHIEECEAEEVFDLSVDRAHSFCGRSVVFHNCQAGDEDHVVSVHTKDKAVAEELEHLLLHRSMLNLDRCLWGDTKNLFYYGDLFWEVLIDSERPDLGVMGKRSLPAPTMFRIETTQGRLLEFQQSDNAPDYSVVTDVAGDGDQKDSSVASSAAIQFAPEQIIHMKLGEDRQNFYPYGVSLLEPARSPSHQLKLMEDSMVVYRLCLTGDTRIRTPHGFKHISDIRRGDTVFTMAGDSLVASTVAWQGQTGTKPVFKVSTRHHQIRATDSHPLLVLREGVEQYVPVSDLRIKSDKLVSLPSLEGRPIPIPRILGEAWARLETPGPHVLASLPWGTKSTMIRRVSLRIGQDACRVKQFLYVNNKALPVDQATAICDAFDISKERLHISDRGEVRPTRLALPDYVNEDFARLWGFLVGDGSVSPHGVGFAASIDPEINNRYCNLMRQLFGDCNRSPDSRRTGESSGSFISSSTQAARILRDMGWVNGAKVKRIPAWAFEMEPHLRRAFIEGLADADGCIRTTSAGTTFTTFELSNALLVQDIKEMWSGIGLASGKLGRRLRKGGHEIEPGRRMIDTESFSVTISDCTLDRHENVLSVESDGVEDVYDIEVDHESHNFVANGVIVHNSRAPERRIFYIDVGTMPPHRAEAYVDRMKDLLRKKKTSSNVGGKASASAIEERWHNPAADEDFWLPTRANSNTRIETLPGASNLGEVDDAIYFRRKLWTALNFPANFLSGEDGGNTRIALSAQDVRFARFVERLQSAVEEGLWEICDRHLRLRGIPQSRYADLVIKLTPPSAWKEMSEQEVISARFGNASMLKGSQIYDDFTILTRILKHDPEEAEAILSRKKIQVMEEMKLQMIMANPAMLGVGTPGPAAPQPNEFGAEPGGPVPMDPNAMPPEGDPAGGMTTPRQEDGEAPAGNASPLPEPEDQDLRRYDLEIQNHGMEQDHEEIDFSL